MQNDTPILKLLRLEQGLTQTQLAKKLKVRTQFISNVERNISNFPVTKIKRCAQVLGVDPEVFIKMNIERHESLIRKRLKMPKTQS